MERERGSVTLWMVGVVALATVMAVFVMREAGAAASAGRAQAVADLTALAGVSGDRAASDDVARRNGADLVDFRRDGDVVAVEVRREGVRATAHAAQGEITTGADDPLDSPSWPPTHPRWRRRHL